MAKQKILGLEIDIPDNLINNIRNIPQHFILIAIAVVFAIIFATMWWFFIKPMQTELGVLKTEVTALTQERDEKKKRVAKIPILKEQAAKLEEQIAIMSKVVPPRGNVPILLIDLERLALKNNSKLTSFKNSPLQAFTGVTQQAQVSTTTPQPAPAPVVGSKPASSTVRAKVEDRLKELPVNVTEDATFSGLLQFTSDLEHYERVVRVNSITVKRVPPSTAATTSTIKATTVLSTTLDITAYVLEGGLQ